MFLPTKQELIIFSLTSYERLIRKKYLVKLCHEMTIIILHEYLFIVRLLYKAYIVNVCKCNEG